VPAILSALFSFLSNGSVTVRLPPASTWLTTLMVAGPASHRGAGSRRHRRRHDPVAIELPRIQGPWHSLVHQLAVAGPFRRLGVATLLMDAAEDLARGRASRYAASPLGCVTSTGPPSGYMPGAATFRMAREHAVRGQVPLSDRARVTMDDDLIIWLTKELYD
jgi:GNAT superfamily N-acetyltransferase